MDFHEVRPGRGGASMRRHSPARYPKTSATRNADRPQAFFVYRERPMTTALNAPGETEFEALHAARIIESVVGNAWATDAAGKFTYMTPAALSVLGMTLDELNSASQEG